MVRFRHVAAGVSLAISLVAQPPKNAGVAACYDSKILPKLTGCRVDTCEKKASDQRNAPVREDKGQPVTAAIEGDSRSIMYECDEGTTSAALIEAAVAGLETAGFSVVYKFAAEEGEGTLTARKDDVWVLLEAASRYYTLTELKSAPPDFDSITDAEGFADALEHYGHATVRGIQFVPGSAAFQPESVFALKTIATMLEDHPDWRVRVEGHTDNLAGKLISVPLSTRRAAAVVTWLVGRGIKRARLDAVGLGDSQPVATTYTQEGRAKNQRIEIVRLASETAEK
jgi:outer membrane protein OmpA-like peptidoglycan-associated protein